MKRIGYIDGRRVGGFILAGTVALNGIYLPITDTTTPSSGITRGLYIKYTASGIKTGSAEVNCFAIDLAINANANNHYVESHYVSQSNNPTGNVFIWGVYMEDLGTNIGNVCAIDIGRVMTNANKVGRDCFFRAKGHGGNCGSIFYLEGTGDALAAQLITICGVGGVAQFAQLQTTLTGGIVGRIRIAYESIPGGGLEQYYIPVYTS